MRISRNLAIMILKYLDNNPKFYFPFLVMCQEYTPEDDDFVEIEPAERKNIEENDIYQTFELWENLQLLYRETLSLMTKWFIEKITKSWFTKEIRDIKNQYKKLYKRRLTESAKIEEYGTNEFFWGKAEAFEEAIEIINRYIR